MDPIITLSYGISLVALISGISFFAIPKYKELFYSNFEIEDCPETSFWLIIIHIIFLIPTLNTFLIVSIVFLVCLWIVGSGLYFIKYSESLKEKIKELYTKFFK